MNIVSSKEKQSISSDTIQQTDVPSYNTQQKRHQNVNTIYDDETTAIAACPVVPDIAPVNGAIIINTDDRHNVWPEAVRRMHDDVIKWKHFPRYWPFVRGIHRLLVNSPQKGEWCGALMFSLICVWINGWVNNREAGDLRRDRAHYEVIVMVWIVCPWYIVKLSWHCDAVRGPAYLSTLIPQMAYSRRYQSSNEPLLAYSSLRDCLLNISTDNSQSFVKKKKNTHILFKIPYTSHRGQ